MRIFSQFELLFMACIVVVHVPATFAPARAKLASPPIPPRLSREGENRKKFASLLMICAPIDRGKSRQPWQQYNNVMPALLGQTLLHHVNPQFLPKPVGAKFLKPQMPFAAPARAKVAGRNKCPQVLRWPAGAELASFPMIFAHTGWKICTCSQVNSRTTWSPRLHPF